MKKLASTSEGRVRRSSSHQALESCTEVKKVAIELTTLAQGNPSSPEVSIKASMIIASSEVKCTSKEKTALSSIDADFKRAIGIIEKALEHIQKELVTLTGSTASPEIIAAKTTTATTTSTSTTTSAPQGDDNPPTTTTTSTPAPTTSKKYSGLIISGGEKPLYSAGPSVEVYIPSTGQHCHLPDLPGDPRYFHTMEEMTVCGGREISTRKSCLTLIDGIWQNTTTLLRPR